MNERKAVAVNSFNHSRKVSGLAPVRRLFIVKLIIPMNNTIIKTVYIANVRNI